MSESGRGRPRAYAVVLAPSAERDIRQVYEELRLRARAGWVTQDFPDRWFEDVEDGISGLLHFAERHPYAPEREAWGRDVRNVLLSSGYRVLYRVQDDTVWVLHVRHQRQQQLDHRDFGGV